MSEAAQQLVAAGWRVLPVVGGGKQPLLPRWQHEASIDPATIAAWWKATPEANVGILTGHKGVFVLDVDVAGGKPGSTSLAALEVEHGSLPVTLETCTASGGRHLFFTSPETIRNSAGKLGPGLDIRGHHGFVIAPPSVTPTGAYTWANLVPVAAAPAWLVELARGAAPTSDAAMPMPATVEVTPELLADLRSALATIPADGRDDWISVGCALRALGNAGRELWLEWSATSRAHNPDIDPDAWETLGHDSTGPAAVFAAAQRRGWQNPAAMRRAAEIFGRQPLPGHALRMVDISNIEHAAIRPPRFVVERIVPAGHVTLLGGHGGAGKSILALAIAAHVAAGVPWAGLAVEGGPALYVSLEDPGELVRFRLRRVIAACGLEATSVTERLRIVDGTSAGALMTEHASFGTRSLIETPALAELRALVCDASLIVVDNASDAFMGNENARVQVRMFLRTLADLSRPYDAAVMLLAHIDKNAARFGSNGNSYSGSSAWHNSARSRLALIHGKGNVIELRHEKSNLGPLIRSLRMVWTEGGVLVPLVGTGADPAEDDAGDLLVAIRAAIEDGVTVPTARTGPATTQRVLEAVPELPERLRGTLGREAFWTAIATLQRSGRIVVEEYQNEHRHRREKFVCVSSPVCASSPTSADQ